MREVESGEAAVVMREFENALNEMVECYHTVANTSNLFFLFKKMVLDFFQIHFT